MKNKKTNMDYKIKEVVKSFAIASLATDFFIFLIVFAARVNISMQVIAALFSLYVILFFYSIWFFIVSKKWYTLVGIISSILTPVIISLLIEFL